MDSATRFEHALFIEKYACKCSGGAEQSAHFR